MNKALSFLRLDFRLIKPYGLAISLPFVIGMGMGWGFKSPDTVLYYCMAMLMLFITYPFSIGEKNDLDVLYGTLSINRRTVVVGRYLFVLVLEILCLALALFGAFIVSAVTGVPFELSGQFPVLSFLFGAFSLLVAVQYPIYFGLDYSKAKFIALLPLLPVILFITQLPALMGSFGTALPWGAALAGMTDNPALPYLAPVIGVAVLVLSCLVSCSIYARRDL